jgi:hypothetical protein
MKSLKEFQEHYEIEDIEEAKAEYSRYLEALALFQQIDERREARMPDDAEEGADVEEKP